MDAEPENADVFPTCFWPNNQSCSRIDLLAGISGPVIFSLCLKNKNNINNITNKTETDCRNENLDEILNLLAKLYSSIEVSKVLI